MMSVFVRCWLLAVWVTCCFSARGQEPVGSDELFQAARKAVFGQKDYPTAKTYLYRALVSSPDYSDIRIFLGRIYAWTGQYDSAAACFRYVLSAHPEYEDAAIAYIDLEYWNDHYTEGEQLCREALRYHPASEELLLRKAKILAAARRYAAADSVTQQILHAHPDNTVARRLQDRIRELSARNKVDLTYDFVYFDKEFDAPWHLVSADYGRSMAWGTLTGRINYANRFQENGLQFELESYPHISRTFYAYAEAAWSNNDGIFPQWRAGFSLYANLPSSFEGELGFRYLDFSGSPTWIYTAYLGKYYKSWLFGVRTYLTPATYSNAVSNSYSVSARYYYGSADDYIGATAGYGISPDDRYNVIQLDSRARLTTYKFGMVYKRKVFPRHIFSAGADWFNQEYLPGLKGNQYQIGVAWQYRF